ncbi:MAG: lyase [Betaproteobacteria bacterium RIFCSPLOWO2_12_FULL_65_14]|nr:MAG: lyase [Betaproteobacteria bacterium RIFCSPLOWO2_12_FULL_65_14]
MIRLLLLWLLPAIAAAQVSVQEFTIPGGHRVHDVWADPAPDGPVWFSAQGSGHLGILHPKSGKVEFVPLGRGSSPHGVVAGPDGAPWLTDGGQNAIVRVDPRTRAVKAWKLPESAGYANLNTAIFDAKGVHWFTGQSGVYGRLDPRSGDMRVFKAPKGRGPYGIHVTPDGTVYYASLAGSYVGRIDGVSGNATVIEPPTPRQGARRVWSDSKGNVWVAEWNSGNLSRYEPKTGRWSSWKAPGDAPQVYAVYVDETDKVWAAEWAAQAMLRFDPASAKFESYKSSSPHPNVRQIHGRKGEVWTPESGADKIVVYRYK